MIDTTDINLPDVVAEVSAAFERYEHALVTNDIATLDSLFWESALVIRFGRGENLYGIDAIRAFRSARSTSDLARDLSHVVITTFGRDAATANTEFRGADAALQGRQSQTWMRLSHGWC
ncbi:MAG: oxalurate catabolism protein HpxZ, partial [Pseudomonadota bacterium]